MKRATEQHRPTKRSFSNALGGDGDVDRAPEVHPRDLALRRDGTGGERERGRQRAAVGREAAEALHGHARPQLED